MTYYSRFTFCLCLFLFLATLHIFIVDGAFAGGGAYYVKSVYGYVRDTNTQAGIYQAQVEIKQTNGILLSSGTTNSSGYYSLRPSGSGTIEVIASKDGYTTQVKNINFTASIAVDFALNPVPVDDTTPPTGTIEINNGAAYTNSLSVTLNLSASDSESDVVQMKFSNDSSTWSTPETYSTTKTWSLEGSEGTKTVYVMYEDSAGNWSDAYSDTIILDMTPPVVVILSPTDGIIVNDSQIQLEGTVDGVTFSESRSLVEGENTLTKTATDDAGNSSSASVNVFYSTQGQIGPDGGEVFSSDGKVKVVIPAGALSSTVTITIETVPSEILEGSAPQGAAMLSAVDCEPYGLNFNIPVSITYTLSQPEVPGTEIELGLYDSAQDEIVPTGQVSVVAEDGYSVTFQLDHFSTYAALKNLVSQGAPIGSFVKIPLPDMFTGAYSQSIPISIPPGRKGMQPGIAFTYRSSGPNGSLGVGFNLNPGYIVRSTRLGPPSYIDTQDTFYFVTDAGTTELVYLVDNLYQAKIESSFSKFYKEPDDSWRVLAKDGSQVFFGQTIESKEVATNGTFAWYLTKAQDTNGNYFQNIYIKDQGKPYLSRMEYTGNINGTSPTNCVEFNWEARDDVFSSYISGSKITTAMRLNEVRVKVNSELVWRYVLEYAYSDDTNRSLLNSIVQYTSDGSALPVQRFSYQGNE